MSDDREAVPRRAALAAILLLPLAACGRRGRPEPPEDADPAYPRRYPREIPREGRSE
jgi:predicted small lipoprotein YifL